MARVGYWNQKVHYQPVILNAVPPARGYGFRPTPA